MKIGILGSGAVGVKLAEGFTNEGHDVWLVTRDLKSDKATEIQTQVTNATVCDFETAAREADIAVMCVKWDGVEEAIKLAGTENLSGKIVMDTTNLIAMEGETMVYAAPEKSGGEQIQAWLPDSHVVKAFNTVGAAEMYQPDFGDTKPTMFIAGDDMSAKQQVRDFCVAFGWDPLDAGGIIASRNLEPMALLWINNSMATGSGHHAFKML